MGNAMFNQVEKYANEGTGLCAILFCQIHYFVTNAAFKIC
jgi:hypothetical protein